MESEYNDIIAKIKEIRPELKDDRDVLEFALQNTLSDLESGCTSIDVDRMIGRMEQLETRLLEQSIVNRKICKKIGL
jgi:hypothetical protein